MRDLPAAGAL